MSKLILASASPRRLDLLRQIDIEPDEVLPADIDETVLKSELPTNYAKRMAAEKAKTISSSKKDCFILAADTVVSCGRRILPKAEDIETAEKCLNILSGRRHAVIGGITIIAPDGRTVTRTSKTTVSFKRLSKLEIKAYLDSNEWNGKAGGYAIQGIAACFIRSISGSYSNVVGLSLHDTYKILSGLGYKKACTIYT